MWIISLAGGIIVGLIIGFLFQKNRSLEVESELNSKIKNLEENRTNIELKQKDEIKRIKENQEVELKSHKLEIEKQVTEEVKNSLKDEEKKLKDFENILRKRDENLDNRSKNLDNRDKNLSRKEINLEKQEKQLQNKIKKQNTVLSEIEASKDKIVDELERISGFTTEQAKDTLFKRIEDEVKHQIAKKVQKMVTEAEEKAEEDAKKIIGQAIQRYAGEYVSEKTVSVVHLSSDDMKGRIIGREGRNIRAFEAATGVDLIIDETPEAVVLSSFNPVRREVARISLERLIEDGRIHPARIEEIVKKTELEINDTILKSGKNALMELNIPPNMHNELVKMIGMLKYRTSYGQNIWQHSIEVGFLCGVMAGELGINIQKARRAGLLHDIGKAIDHEVEGSHAIIGANFAKKYGEKNDIVHAIEAHHNDVPPETILAFIVDAADALSGARPGARRETMESFVKRLQDIEEICKSFTGVQKSFAIQAGREVRVIVEHDKITDDDAIILSQDLAKKIESDVTYPGQIKIVVIREKRVVAYAS